MTIAVREIHGAYGIWEPATPAEIYSIFGVLDVPWWVARGYAIELAVGHPFRAHGDIDILRLRRDQQVAQQVLVGWEWWAADPPGVLRPWATGERLPDHVHDIRCRPGVDLPWRLQIMLDEADGQDWVSRRNPRLHRPLTCLDHTDPQGIPYLAPEVQLLYKAARPRPKDEIDFATMLPLLATAQRRWLRDAIADTYGAHPWSASLQTDGLDLERPE